MARITYADAVIDAVLLQWRATSGFRAPTTDSADVPVYDGLEALLTSDRPGSFVIVGYGGEDTIDPGDPSDDASEGTVSASFRITSTSRAM